MRDKYQPVVSEIVRVKVLNGQDVFVVDGLHREPVSGLEKEGVLIPQQLERYNK